jgi:hypothetical protein
MAPACEVGLAMALPRRLGSAIAGATRHVQLALSGLARWDHTFAKLGGLAGNTPPRAALKHREATNARNSRTSTKQRLAPAPDRAPPEYAMSLREQRRPAATQSRAATVRSVRATTGAHVVLMLADSASTASSARPRIVPVNGSDRSSAAGSQPAQLGVVRPPAASGVAEDTRHSTGLSPGTVSAHGGKASSIAAQGAVAVTAPAPIFGAARLTMMNGQRRPNESRSSAQSTARPAQSDGGSAPSASLPPAQNFRPNQAFRPGAPPAPSVATAAFAPVGRAVAPAVAGASSAAMRVPPPTNSRGENESFATTAALDGAAAANGDETVVPTSGGPTQGDVFLDGTLVGRWLARKLAHEVGRPPSGSPAFDPTRSPFPPGRMIGG